jgi:hypothetical protein
MRLSASVDLDALEPFDSPKSLARWPGVLHSA